MKDGKTMSTKRGWLALVSLLLISLLAAGPSPAQESTFGSEDFTTSTTVNNWYYFGGACLTAGTSAPGSNPGLIPGCTSVLGSYYNLAANADPYMMGGNNGYLGSSTAPANVAGQVADPVVTNADGSVTGYGALRFTNGSMNISGSEKYGHNERGAILSSSTFPTNQGFQVTFKTVTYHGDSGHGSGTFAASYADGADGISFFLQDGKQAAGLGAWGGSLAYACSNSNTPHDGLVGGYLGLGIDEYGNFLNGTYLVSGYTGTNVAGGDNSAYGYGYSPAASGCAARETSHGPRSRRRTATTRTMGPRPTIRSRSRPPAPLRAAPTAPPPAIASTSALPADRSSTRPPACATMHAPPTTPTTPRPIPATVVRA